jgi:copper transport protein
VVLSAHTIAALTWIGGLAVLAFLTAQLGEHRGQALRLWKAFGPVAAGCVAVLSVTGLLLAGRQVATVDAALGTLYGGALLAKLLIVAAVMLLGLRHARRLHPWLTRLPGRQPATPTPRGQAVAPLLGVGALLFAVVLAVTPPARGPQFDKAATAVSRTAYQVDDLLITVTLGPNQPGRSLLLVDAVSSRRPVPGPITAVTADLGTTTGIVLRRTSGGLQGDARWQAAVDVDATGDLPLRIVAVRNHPGPATVSGTWVVPSGLAPRAVVVSNSPLAPWTDAGAAVVAALALALATILGIRNRRRVPAVPEQSSEPHDLAQAGTHS